MESPTAANEFPRFSALRKFARNRISSLDAHLNPAGSELCLALFLNLEQCLCCSDETWVVVAEVQHPNRHPEDEMDGEGERHHLLACFRVSALCKDADDSRQCGDSRERLRPQFDEQVVEVHGDVFVLFPKFKD
ncbi:MAG: hypothetical protein HY056_05015 [Proteobacteria bacterium]|nr:hypothetical protein [Pseudomonadota bacterium]